MHYSAVDVLIPGAVRVIGVGACPHCHADVIYTEIINDPVPAKAIEYARTIAATWSRTDFACDAPACRTIEASGRRAA